jgi:hypothetical protein
MAFLYINSKGQQWRKHSYSAGNTYDQCPYKYFLQKVQGWKPRDNRGSFLFGRAIEEAIQHHHDFNGEGAVEDFQRRWLVHKDNTEILYTKTEKDWENLFYVGTDMVRLYVIRQPELPIPMGGSTVFQREYEKEVFPNDPNYGGILDAGKLDIVSYVVPDHPSLRKIEWKPEYGALRPIIIDIKTAATDFSESPGMAAFDKQLRRYSWLSGVRDVGLLWFKKTSRKLSKGVSVTVLADVVVFNPVGANHTVLAAGKEAVIAKVDGDNVWLVHNDFMLEQMSKAQGQVNGKTIQTSVAKDKAEAWLKENGYCVPASQVTRQRLQFNCGFVTIESANDAGQIAARQIVSIVNSWKTKTWPNTFGIRYPSDDSHDPYFRAFVLNDPGYRDQNFKKSDQESLDDLFDDETPEEV